MNRVYEMHKLYTKYKLYTMYKLYSEKSEKMGLAMGWIEKKVKKKIVTIVEKWGWLRALTHDL